jgi:hypothetical protein
MRTIAAAVLIAALGFASSCAGAQAGRIAHGGALFAAFGLARRIAHARERPVADRLTL